MISRGIFGRDGVGLTDDLEPDCLEHLSGPHERHREVHTSGGSTGYASTAGAPLAAA